MDEAVLHAYTLDVADISHENLSSISYGPIFSPVQQAMGDLTHDEELSVSGSCVTWSTGYGRFTRETYSFSADIIQASWCKFADIGTPSIFNQASDVSLCVLAERDCLHIFTPDGSCHNIPLPFRAYRFTPLQRVTSLAQPTPHISC